LSLNTLRCLLAPPLPKPLPPLPLPDIVNMYYLFYNGDFSGMFFFFLCVFCLFLSLFEGLLFSFATEREINEDRWPFREERRGYFLKTPQRGFKAGGVNLTLS